MFYAMGFYKTEYDSVVVRAVRVNPFKSLDAAIRAIKKVGHGYVKKHGERAPVWTNL